ncbi:MAG: nucleotide exchange factor GrpE [Bacilli bacterium]
MSDKEEEKKKKCHKEDSEHLNDKECHCHQDEDHCDSKCECDHDDCHCDNTNHEDDLMKEITELKNKFLLSQADLVNYRKRKDEEVTSLLKYANQDLILELLPILDNFERAINLDDDNLNDELSKFLTGFKMMYNHFVETFKNYGLEEIPALGIEFNPNTMDAIVTENDNTKADNLVVEVLMKGYLLKGRVIRPATVKVNKIEESK